MLNLNHARFSEYVIYQGLAATLCGAVLYGLTTLLKREIPGKYDSLQLSTCSWRTQRKLFSFRSTGLSDPRKTIWFLSAMTAPDSTARTTPFLMVPAIIAIAFWTFASIASEDTVQSALLWGLTALSFASVSTKRMLPTAIVAAPVAFTTRILLDFSVTGFFQSLLVSCDPHSAAVVASKILRTSSRNAPLSRVSLRRCSTRL